MQHSTRLFAYAMTTLLYIVQHSTRQVLLLKLVTSAAAFHWLYSCSYCIAAIAIVGQDRMREVYDARGSMGSAAALCKNIKK